MIFKRKSAVDWIIAGLGNPEPKYQMTRHNAGFLAVDKIAEKYGCRFSGSKFKALTAKCEIGDRKVLLLKPLTYMNLSGEAIRDAAAFYKVPSTNILVLFDDISLDVGKLRIRRNGSDGGHNGIKSICLYFDQDFPRIKLGVGKKPNPDYDLAAWVLSKFTQEETPLIHDAADCAAKAAEMIVSGQIDRAMNRFNS